MVLVHGLLVILDSRRFSPVEVRRWVGPCTMGESRLTSWVEISHQVSRRHGDRYGESKDTSTKISNIPPYRTTTCSAQSAEIDAWTPL